MTDQPQSPPRIGLLRVADLIEHAKLTRRTIYDLIKHPDPDVRLPAPFKIGRGTFWRAAEIEAWIDRQAARAA